MVKMEIISKNHQAFIKVIHDNDWSEMVNLLRERIGIEEYNRELIADKLEGKFSSKPGPRKDRVIIVEKYRRAIRIYNFLTICDDWQKDAAKERTAEIMKVSKKHLNKIFSDYHEFRSC
jgi:hypothetical protein